MSGIEQTLHPDVMLEVPPALLGRRPLGLNGSRESA